MTRLLNRFAGIILMVLTPLIVAAQNPFEAIITVNEDVITRFELEQRQRLLSVIAPANAGSDTARQELIDDRLRAQAVRVAGGNITQDAVNDAIDAFASRANLTGPELVQLLGQQGVERETLEDFVAIGTLWREYVRARFGARATVSEAEIDRALQAAGSSGGLRVLLSEIIIPAPPPRAEAVLALADTISQTRSIDEFSSFARQYSATASRGRGGRLEWTTIDQLPPVLQPLILSLSVGEVTDPLQLPNAVALFQLRGIEEGAVSAPTYTAIEYAQYFIPGGRSDAALSEAARIRSRVDVCDDLYGVARGQPEERLQRETRAPADIPTDIALELAKLDDNEVSTALVSADGTQMRFLMLCGRSTAATEDIDREGVANRLRSERLAAMASSLLDELRSTARIVEK